MTYLEFHRQWHSLGCFNIRQIYAWHPDFNRLNLRNWEKKGLIMKLRKEFYAFSDCKSLPDFAVYVANRIYRPSYISLHSALAHYGMIPESVGSITSVTSLKTMQFSNELGEYSYKSVKPHLMFGYVPKPMNDGRNILFATPEKALLDLLYIYPFYRTEQDMLDLRLDEDFMLNEFNAERFREYVDTAGIHALAKRAHTLINTYLNYD